MLGLICKDLSLLKTMRKLLATMLAISVIMMVSGNDIGFVVGYVTIICGILVISTINYDEKNNSMTFFMTLPVTRKEYVLEKYLLGFLLGGGGWLAAFLIGQILLRVRGSSYNAEEFLITCLVYLGIQFLVMAVTIPIELKYGGEKGRMAMFVMFMMVFAAAYALSKFAAAIEISWGPAIQWLAVGNRSLFAATAVIATALLISIQISFRFMEKKEF